MVKIFSLVAHKVFTFFVRSGAKRYFAGRRFTLRIGQRFSSPRCDFVAFFYCFSVHLSIWWRWRSWVLTVGFCVFDLKLLVTTWRLCRARTKQIHHFHGSPNCIEDFFARRLRAAAKWSSFQRKSIFYWGDTHGYVRKMIFRSLSP